MNKTTRLTKRAPRRPVLLERPGQLYSAKLLFQYRIVVGGRSDVRRVCEERVVLLRARSEREALARCIRWGRGEHRTEFRPGRRIDYEFLGLTGLNTSFFSEVEDPTEVWYEFSIKLRPSERRHELIPPLHALDAFAEPDGRLWKRLYGEDLGIAPRAKSNGSRGGPGTKRRRRRQGDGTSRRSAPRSRNA